jgi:excisionase family DNA binding protein
MTTQEVAQLLEVSLKTLANWRAKNIGPPHTGRRTRIAYEREAVMQWLAEREARAGTKPKNVFVSAPIYKNDATRFLVSIMFEHPIQAGEMFRTRKVSPAGLNHEAALAWGREQAIKIHMDLVRAHGKQEQEAKTQKSIPTIAELWELYEKKINSKATAPGVNRDRWKQMKDLVGSVKVPEWSKDHNEALVDRFKNNAPSYANRFPVLLKLMFRLAEDEGIIDEIPSLPKRRKETQKLIVAHNKEDVDQLQAMAEKLGGGDLSLLLMLAVDTGMRSGEIAALKWSDVDWNAGQLLVRASRPAPGVERQTKTEQERRVTMSTRLKAAMKARAKIGKSYIFLSRGKPMWSSQIAYRIARVHKALKASGYQIEVRRGHFLRHTSGSLIRGQGASLAQVQDHLGHRRASTTEGYLHRVRGSDAGREAAAFMDKVHGHGKATAKEGSTRPKKRSEAP